MVTPTDVEQIISVIKELKNTKSSELDGISSSLIKMCYIHLIKPLTFIINLSLNTGEFPELLKIAKVRPLLKKGSKYEVENYRPISMISTISRILEKIVSIRLIKFWERNNIFIECQGRSTNTALNNFLECVYEMLDKGEACVGLFLDLTKAFDMVNHDRLLQKLQVYGIRGVAYQWFVSYLTNRKQLVEIEYLNTLSNVIKYKRSEKKIITYGVPHWDICCF